MTEHDSREIYTQRMHRVIRHIDEHLDQPLDLVSLVEVAHFSPFHFHRLFAAWTGETLGDYVRRRRVESAARRLARQPDARVLPVALSVGFGSAEALARAFRARFSCSPSAWRDRLSAQTRWTLLDGDSAAKDSKNGQMPPWAAPQDLRSAALGLPTGTHVKIIDREPVHIAYLRCIGPYGQDISAFWQQQYRPWAIANRLGPDHARYGISYDDPGITPAGKCRYDAGAEVPAGFEPTGGALTTTLAGGRYATLNFRGTAEDLRLRWSQLLRDWLPSSGLQLDERPSFEYFPHAAFRDPRAEGFECEMFLPVTPL